MSLDVIPYVAPLLLAAAMCAALMVVALPQRALPGVRWFLVFMAGLVIWSAAYAAELIVPGVAGKVFTAKLQYLGITVIPVAWLAFSAEYADLPWWSRRVVIGAFVVPVSTIVVAWTNGAHGLLWATIGLTDGPIYSVLALEYGPWFWLNLAYAYACLLFATGLLVRVIVVRPRLFRRQAILLAAASVTPWLGNVLYVSGLNPTDLDLTVFGFAISGLVAGWAMLKWRLLSIGPVGREMIVEGLAEGVVVIDHEGRIVDANPAASRVLDLARDRLVGWDAAEALAGFAPPLERSAGSRRTVSGTDGVRSYDCQVEPLNDGQGFFRGWTLVMHDATARVAEAQVLEEARAVAEHTARVQRAFMTNINHEIRTPLNGVLGMLEVLMTTRLSADQKRYAEMASESGAELLELVDRILDFTVIEQGNVELAEDPFELDVVVQDAAEALRERADAKRIGLRFDLRTPLPGPVVGDPRRLAQIVTALVDNAVKFTDTGEVVVELAYFANRDGTARARVEVRDTGIGIAEHELADAFEGFVQVDGSATRRHMGIGLGLSLARKLLDYMGTELEVSSTAGAGSSFWFVVPLKPLSGSPV